MKNEINLMLEALDRKFTHRTDILLDEVQEISKKLLEGKDGQLKTHAGEVWCENCIHREMCKWYGTNGCDRIQDKEGNRIEYYMVFNDEGTGYGAFETLEDAIKSINTHDDFNNSNGSYNHIVKVIEINDEVYRISGKEKE